MIESKQSVGFTYTVDVVDNATGEVLDREVIHNLMPTEGLDHVLGVVLKSATPRAHWYVGVYEGAYTPTPGDMMVDFPADAVECTAYTSATRLVFTPGTVMNGTVDNTAAVAEFAFNATKLIYGGFISSASAKGSGAGILLSAVRFGSPKQMDSSSTLRVTAGFTMASL